MSLTPCHCAIPLPQGFNVTNRPCSLQYHNRWHNLKHQKEWKPNIVMSHYWVIMTKNHFKTLCHWQDIKNTRTNTLAWCNTTFSKADCLITVWFFPCSKAYNKLFSEASFLFWFVHLCTLQTVIKDLYQVWWLIITLDINSYRPLIYFFTAWTQPLHVAKSVFNLNHVSY